MKNNEPVLMDNCLQFSIDYSNVNIKRSKISSYNNNSQNSLVS